MLDEGATYFKTSYLTEYQIGERQKLFEPKNKILS
jgi:hypothetical protein